MTPLAPRIAVRAAEHDLPAGLVAALDGNLRAQLAGDRLDEVLAEVGGSASRSARRRSRRRSARSSARRRSSTSSPRADTRSSSTRCARCWSATGVRRPARSTRRPARRGAPADPDSDELHTALEELRAQAEGLASSEEELLLLGLFGEEAERLLRAIRGRATGADNLEASFERARAERIREVVRIVQETGVGEVTIEEEGMRVSVKRTQEVEPQPAATASAAPSSSGGASSEPVRLERPRIGRGADDRRLLSRARA